MKAILFSIIITIVFSTIISDAQTLAPEDAAKHINDSITVCGVVKEVHFVRKNETYSVYLEFGDRSPNENFSVFISDELRKKSPYDLHTLEGKNICILGKIKIHAKKPLMNLYKFSQIQK
jgi:hypothetical protein